MDFTQERVVFKRKRRLMRSYFFCAAAALVAVACGKSANPPSFTGKAMGSASSASTLVPSTKFTAPTTIDAGDYEANNDLSSSCTAMYTGGTLPPPGAVRGCMQTPAAAYADGRFMFGFSQNYLAGSGLARNSLLAALTSIVSRTFGGFGTGMPVATGAIDSGRGLIPWALTATPTMQTSSRYVRFATFPNGNVIAVYLVELPVNAMYSLLASVNAASYSSVRAVYASIYDASTRTWGAAVKLGTANGTTTGSSTDWGTDFGGNFTPFCRPSVATGGDNSAMVAWCESTVPVTASPTAPCSLTASCAVTPTATDFPMSSVGPPHEEQYSQVMVARYSSGAWKTTPGTPEPLIPDPGLGFFKTAHFINGRNNSFATAAIDPGDQIESAIFSGNYIDTHVQTTTKYEKYSAVVTAVDANAIGPQFNLVRDPFGAVLFCESARNMISALLSTPTTIAVDQCSATSVAAGDCRGLSTDGFSNDCMPYAGGCPTGPTLSQLGVSMILNPSCDSDSTQSSTWTISTYYNRSLRKSFQRTYLVGPGIAGVFSVTNSNFKNTIADLRIKSLGKSKFRGISSSGTFMPQSVQSAWNRSAMVDVAGDGLGNYALVRSYVMPWFQDDDVSATGISEARALAGHQYSAALGEWVRRPGGPAAPLASEPDITVISDHVSCTTDPQGSTHYVPCSVRNPKMLMSDSGKGLVLFHQNQAASPSPTVQGPNRLYWASYSTNTGFSSVASPLDNDTVCSQSSNANDSNVCEAQSYGAYSWEPALNGFNPRCQTVGEPPALATVPLIPGLTADPQPIAAMMNRSGAGLVAYTKPALDFGATTPKCTNIGTFVVTYDAFNGFGDTIRVDDGLSGDSMHPAVFVTPSGAMAVVWEQVVGSGFSALKYVYLKTRQNGSWSAAVQINTSSQLNSVDSMMPAVAINDRGEIAVTYTYGGVNGAARRQYVRHYYFH